MNHTTWLEPADFLAAVLVGFVGSLHCVGMCGGFAAAASLPTGSLVKELPVVPPRRFLASQTLYHVGKVTSYLLLGVLAASVGVRVLESGTFGARALGVLAGGCLLVLGATLLGKRRGSTRSSSGRSPTRSWARAGSALFTLSYPVRPLLLGVFSGLLPCPLVYAFLGAAAARGSLVAALVTMVGLGVGTAPALTLAGTTSSFLGKVGAQRCRVIAGLGLVALGCWTLYRGWVAPPCCTPGS